MSAACSIPGCGRPAIARTFCSHHYSKWSLHGDPCWQRKETCAEWLQRHAREYIGDDCLKWPFATDIEGYGVVRFRGRDTSASRAMCFIVHGDPPTPKHQAAHSCGKGHLGCVNPRHIRWATCFENIQEKRVHGTMNYGTRRDHRGKGYIAKAAA